jgi:uncharacterized protein YmfQ (DUF2313 family)
MRSVEDYQQMIAALLPTGKLWRMLLDNPIFQGLIGAAADELRHIDERALALIEETDPRTADELLQEWEDYMALPDPCSPAPATLEDRRTALHAKRIAIGGQRRAYFIALAAAIGETITIEEFDTWTVGHSVVEPIYNENWRFVWKVHAAIGEMTHFTPRSGVNEPLRHWQNDPMECLFRRHKPAHSIVLFAYT